MTDAECEVNGSLKHSTTNTTIIMSPTRYMIDENEIEISIHTPSKLFISEIRHVFQNLSLECLLVLPTMQRARMDLLNVGNDVALEKDRLLETFADFAKVLCDKLLHLGHWADYIDPCSGLPMLTPDCNKVYDEVAGAQNLLRYKVMDAGCCKILLHPDFGSSVYPATLFTTCPISELQAVLAEIVN